MIEKDQNAIRGMIRRCPRTCADVAGLSSRSIGIAQVTPWRAPHPGLMVWVGPCGVRRIRTLHGTDDIPARMRMSPWTNDNPARVRMSPACPLARLRLPGASSRRLASSPGTLANTDYKGAVTEVRCRACPCRMGVRPPVEQGICATRQLAGPPTEFVTERRCNDVSLMPSGSAVAPCCHLVSW